MLTPSTSSPPTLHGVTALTGRVRSCLDTATVGARFGHAFSNTLPGLAQGPHRIPLNPQAGCGTCR
ncbi:hypothetical protein [Streptomyces sp. NPDC047061]|uniref:hypothetical protein n=1 Tax=Streptomyces sp. NPDC047061 TaxID=3154605 RepID=UPI0033D6081A